MNIVAIDPSTTCTGICINGDKMVTVAQENLVLSKKGEFTKWFELSSNFCDIKTYESYQKKCVFTDSEIEKLRYYQKISDLVIETIEEQCGPTNTRVYIEGFSYSSKAGNLIDLVTFSTLIRSKLLNKEYDLTVVPPMSLKMNTAALIYPAVDVNNVNRDPSLKPRKTKMMHLNNDGIAGGKFNKHEMLGAIKDSKFEDVWKKFIDEHYSDIQDMKSIPAPIADLNDAYLLYQYGRIL